jgi:hypothetical protein
MSIRRLFDAVERRGDIGRRIAALVLPIPNRPRVTSSCARKLGLREPGEHTSGPNLASRDNVAHNHNLHTYIRLWKRRHGSSRFVENRPGHTLSDQTWSPFNEAARPVTRASGAPHDRGRTAIACGRSGDRLKRSTFSFVALAVRSSGGPLIRQNERTQRPVDRDLHADRRRRHDRLGAQRHPANHSVPPPGGG